MSAFYAFVDIQHRVLHNQPRICFCTRQRYTPHSSSLVVVYSDYHNLLLIIPQVRLFTVDFTATRQLRWRSLCTATKNARLAIANSTAVKLPYSIWTRLATGPCISNAKHATESSLLKPQPINTWTIRDTGVRSLSAKPAARGSTPSFLPISTWTIRGTGILGLSAKPVARGSISKHQSISTWLLLVTTSNTTCHDCSDSAVLS